MSNSSNNTVLTTVIAEMWEHSDITRIKSDKAKDMSYQVITLVLIRWDYRDFFFIAGSNFLSPFSFLKRFAKEYRTEGKQ